MAQIKTKGIIDSEGNELQFIPPAPEGANLGGISSTDVNKISTISTDLGSKSSASSVTGDDAFSKINTLNNALNELKDHERFYIELGNNNTIDVRRKDKIVEIYISVQTLATGNSVQIHRLDQRFRPKYNYSLGVFYAKSSPYTPNGSVWLDSNGILTVYKPSNVISGYGHIVYVIDE